MQRRSTQQAFSLFDLMITMAVLSIVASVAIPSMQSAIEKRNTTAAAEAIYSNIQLARSESISRSAMLFMNLSPGTDWSFGFSTDQNCDPTDNNPACTLPDLDNNNPITHRVTFNDHDTVTIASTSNQITFSPQRGTASPATITVTSEGDQGYIIRVNVGVLGQVSMCSPDTDPAAYVTAYQPCS
jgi:type IV fimbrial biogenesis protein FimT